MVAAQVDITHAHGLSLIQIYALRSIVPADPVSSLGGYGNRRSGKHAEAIMCHGQRTTEPTRIESCVDPAERVPART
jgi:hypothetical protein